jgi:hypothetical protein
MHVDQLFLVVHGMDERVGFTTPNLAEAATDRALIACAREVIVLADSSKWGVVGLADIAPLSAAHTVITDDQLPAEGVRVLRDRVRSLVLVSADAAATSATMAGADVDTGPVSDARGTAEADTDAGEIRSAARAG